MSNMESMRPIESLEPIDPIVLDRHGNPLRTSHKSESQGNWSDFEKIRTAFKDSKYAPKKGSLWVPIAIVGLLPAFLVAGVLVLLISLVSLVFYTIFKGQSRTSHWRAVLLKNGRPIRHR